MTCATRCRSTRDFSHAGQERSHAQRDDGPAREVREDCYCGTGFPQISPGILTGNIHLELCHVLERFVLFVARFAHAELAHFAVEVAAV